MGVCPDLVFCHGRQRTPIQNRRALPCDQMGAKACPARLVSQGRRRSCGLQHAASVQEGSKSSGKASLTLLKASRSEYPALTSPTAGLGGGAGAGSAGLQSRARPSLQSRRSWLRDWSTREAEAVRVQRLCGLLGVGQRTGVLCRVHSPPSTSLISFL